MPETHPFWTSKEEFPGDAFPKIKALPHPGHIMRFVLSIVFEKIRYSYVNRRYRTDFLVLATSAATACSSRPVKPAAIR